MGEALWLVVGLVVGGVVSGVTVWFAARARGAGALAAAEARLDELATARELADSALTEERVRRERAEQAVARLEASLEAERRAIAEQRTQLDEAKSGLVHVFRSVGAEALQETQTRFVHLAKETLAAQQQAATAEFERRREAIEATLTPIRDLLKRQETAIGELESRRSAAYAAIETQIKGMIGASELIRVEASKLSTALKRSDTRGRWGEVALQNLVDLAGMKEHVDYETQVYVAGEEGALRPDLIVRMPGGGAIVVDAKVPLDSFLQAIEQPERRQELLESHAKALRGHVDMLAGKAYWNRVANSPGYVVLFVPVESALSAALEARPDLQEYALRSRVILASSGIFLALLQAVALFWRHEDLTKNAERISEVGAQLHERLAKFATHLAKVGKSLDGAGRAYNDAIGSLEQRVVPSARQLETLNVQLRQELEVPEPVALEVRPIVAAKLIENASEADDARS